MGWSQLRIRKDAVWLYAAQLSTYCAPLVTFPFLARVLGPSGWGNVAFFQAIGFYGSLIIEFGFNLSGTRTVARCVDRAAARGQIVTDITSAKLILGGIAATTFIPAYLFVGLLHSQPKFLGASLCLAIAQGFNMLWYFQGRGKTHIASVAELIGRALSTALIFGIVRQPQHGFLVLIFMSIGSFTTSGMSLWIACRTADLQAPSFRRSLAAIKESYPMFLFRSAVTVYTAGNAILLGFLAPATAVGFYAGAEKISRGCQALLTPLFQLSFADVQRSVPLGRATAARVAAKRCIQNTAVGLAMSLGLLLFAPLAVRLTLGPGFERAVSTVRVMAPLPLLVSLGVSLGSNWLLALRHDKAFVTVVWLAGAVDLTLGIVLAPRLQEFGMGIAATACEVFVCLAFIGFVLAKKINPFSMRSRERAHTALEPGELIEAV